MTDVSGRPATGSDPTKWATTGTGLGSIRLQKPEFIYFGGAVRPWDEAVLHVGTEAVVRGLNVFEGLKGYWQADGGFGWVHLKRHYARMCRSARLLHIPVPVSYEEFEQACVDLTRALYRPDREFYIRAMLMVVEGHYGAGTVADLILAGYQQDKGAPKPIAIGVSTWRRTSDDVMPARIKAGANYQLARIARIEGRSRGYEDMILLNAAGRVSESTGACVLMVREGVISTTPTWEGAMESITVGVLEQMAGDLGFPFVHRPIERSELHVADELALTGTLTEITMVTTVDEFALPEEQPILTALLQRYRDAVTGVDPHPSVELTMVPPA